MTESINQTNNQTQITLSEPSQVTDQHPSLLASSFKQALKHFKQFFSLFDYRLQKLYQKENYRIYLNNKFHLRIYNQLLKQKQCLDQALLDSKDYKQSVNRELIEQVMNLEKLKEQYLEKNSLIQLKIRQKKKEIHQKKKAIKLLHTEIKSYFIQSYGIECGSFESHSSFSRITYAKIHSRNQTLKTTKNQTQITTKNQTPATTNYKLTYNQEQHDKQNNPSALNLKENTIQSKTSDFKANSVHLPCIYQRNSYLSTFCCSSNQSKNPNPQRYQRGTILTKDLSLINSSAAKQKLAQKIECSKRRQVIEKLDYEREKLNLLGFFKIYLKKKAESQLNLFQRRRLEKVVTKIQEWISEKDGKLKKIQELVNS